MVSYKNSKTLSYACVILTQNYKNMIEYRMWLTLKADLKATPFA